MTIPPTASGAASDEAAIRDLIARAQEAQSDAEVLVPMHTPTAVVVNLAGRRVLGRESLAEVMRAALASPLGKVRTTVDIVDVRVVLPDVAVVSCLKTVHDRRDEADISTVLPSTGALTYVVTRAEGQWQIAVAQTTPVL